MNRQELLRTAEELRENDDITAAIVKDGWGMKDRDYIEVRSTRGLVWEIQSLVKDGFVIGPHVKETDDGKTKVEVVKG